jgi:hypothetical protein
MRTETTLESAEELAERLLPERTPKAAHARDRQSVCDDGFVPAEEPRRLRAPVALHGQGGRHGEARAHHADLPGGGPRGLRRGVAFGGDGTANEAANGLVGSDTPLTASLGGSSNVWCRTLAILNDVVDATEHLLRMADDFHPRRVDIRLANERHFVLASGVGLDASVVERVDAHPFRTARFEAWYYALGAVAIFNRRYLVNPPVVRVTAGDRTITGVTVIVQNSDPLKYFRGRPIRVTAPAGSRPDRCRRPSFGDDARDAHADPTGALRPRKDGAAPPTGRGAWGAAGAAGRRRGRPAFQCSSTATTSTSSTPVRYGVVLGGLSAVA